jgi:ABC-type polysaccharide/polyol phosphate export permease
MRQILRDTREMFAELLEYRELFYTLVRRDVLVRYRETVLGIGWALFTPVVNMIVFTIIFNRVAKIQTEVPYPIFSYIGLLPWTMFSASLKAGVASLVSNKSLITKVYFPRELLPLSCIVIAFIDFLIGSLLLAALMAYYHIAPAPTIWFVPVLLLVQIVFAAAVSLAVSMANLWFRDVKYIFDVVLQLWMFATPVVYPVRNVGEPLHTILLLNPMTPIIDGYRDVILRNRIPDPGPLGAAAAISLVGLAVAWLVFHRAEYKFAENA